MTTLETARKFRGLSQRALAAKAGVSFRCVQQLEGVGHNWRVDSLRRVARALDLPDGGLDCMLARYLALTPDSAEDIAFRMHGDGFDSWKVHLFNFVDRFRRDRDSRLVDGAPLADLDARLRALLTSTVEALCDETGRTPPAWCRGVPALAKPWFVAGIENLKAAALVESPARFRARNIFVLGNFLDRA
jgi:transcriptional regulator with XRE-family HTH domain